MLVKKAFLLVIFLLVGVSQWAATSFWMENIPLENYLHSIQFQRIHFHNDRLIVCSNQGLFEFHNRKWQVDKRMEGESLVSCTMKGDTLVAISPSRIYATSLRSAELSSEDITEQSGLTLLKGEQLIKIIRGTHRLLLLTSHRLLAIENGMSETLSPPSVVIKSMIRDQHTEIVQTNDGSLFSIDGGSFFRQLYSPLLLQGTLTAIHERTNGQTLYLLSNGLYVKHGGALTSLSESLNRKLAGSTVSCGYFLSDYCVIGTKEKGLYIYEYAGETAMQISTQNSILQDDHIKGITSSGDQTVEVITESGIARIIIAPPLELLGSRTVMGDAQSIEKTADNVTLFTTKGNYLYTPTLDSLISKSLSEEILASDSHNRPDTLLLNGWLWTLNDDQSIDKLKRNNDGKISELIRHAAPHKAIGMVSIDENLVCYNGEALSVFDNINNRIIPYDKLNQQLAPYHKATTIRQGAGECYWFVLNNEAALFNIKDNQCRLLFRVMLDEWGFTFSHRSKKIFSISDSIHLLPALQGIVRLNSHRLTHESADTVLHIEQIIADSICIRSSKEGAIVLPNSYRNLRINIGNHGKKISYKLTPLSGKWSEWQQENELRFDLLPPGNYTLAVRSYSHIGHFPETILKLRILHPWYLRWYSLVACLLLLTGLTFFLNRIIFFRRKKTMEQKLNEEKQAFILTQNRERIEAIETELTERQKELAMQTSMLARYKQLIADLSIELDLQKETLGDRYPNKQYRKLKGMIESDFQEDDYWLLFESYFNQLHQQFLTRLKTNFPDLTPQDLRLCCFLRMNLSTKEIASLMNVTIRAIELRRHRLRKRILLDSDENLTAFMQSY